MTLYEDVMSPKVKIAEGTKYHIYRDYTEDGVIGLNGKQFIRDDNDVAMEFDSVEDAIALLEDHDVDIYSDDLMHIVKTEDVEFTCLIKHNYQLESGE